MIYMTVYRDSCGRADGYSCTGNSSGMDNTPRGRDFGGWNSIRWIDAISQQALAAENIAELLELRGDAAAAVKWRNEYSRLKDIVNRDYWDDKDGFYYDIAVDSSEPSRVMTPASFWYDGRHSRFNSGCAHGGQTARPAAARRRAPVEFPCQN